MRISILAMLSAALLTAPAAAAPVDRELRLSSGEERFERIGVPPRLHIAAPEILHAEILPSGEVLLRGLSPGETLLFFHGSGNVTAWRIRVDLPPKGNGEAALAAAEKACKSFDRPDSKAVVVTIEDAGCRAAVMELHRFVGVDALAVGFGTKALRAQLTAQSEALKKARPDLAATLKLAYVGANLYLRGSVPSAADYDAALRILWAESASRLYVDASEVTVATGEDL